MKWEVGYDLNVTVDPTIITLVRVSCESELNISVRVKPDMIFMV
jgi:hypothetical protein